MKLLDRIAHSNGDPQRAVLALRLINERLLRELSQFQDHSNVELRPEDRATYFDRAESRQREKSLAPPRTR